MRQVGAERSLLAAVHRAHFLSERGALFHFGHVRRLAGADRFHHAFDEIGRKKRRARGKRRDPAQIRALRDRGFAVIGAANPLRHLTGDTDSLAALLGTISGPIVLVGHSYGGAVMSNAATGNDQMQALVFVNGWMPDEGGRMDAYIW